VGHKGNIAWDLSKPDGTPRKLMDVSKMTQAGWQAKIDLNQGIQDTYQWFLQHLDYIKEKKIETI
jgi:GDP-L-fucose synthase